MVASFPVFHAFLTLDLCMNTTATFRHESWSLKCFPHIWDLRGYGEEQSLGIDRFYVLES